MALCPCPRRLSGHAKPPRTRGTQRREQYCWSKAGRICHDNTLSFKGLDIRSRPLTFLPLPLGVELITRFDANAGPRFGGQLISHKKAANWIDPCRCRVRKLGDRTNERRRRNPSTRSVRQSLGLDDAFCARMRAAIAA